MFPFILNSREAVLTHEQAVGLGLSNAAGDSIDVRLHMETVGMWGIVRKCRGLAVEKSGGRIIVHGYRSLNKPKPDGMSVFGYASVGGRRRKAFTSSQIFSLPNGKLAEAGTLYIMADKLQFNTFNEAAQHNNDLHKKLSEGTAKVYVEGSDEPSWWLCAGASETNGAWTALALDSVAHHEGRKNESSLTDTPLASLLVTWPKGSLCDAAVVPVIKRIVRVVDC